MGFAKDTIVIGSDYKPKLIQDLKVGDSLLGKYETEVKFDDIRELADQDLYKVSGPDSYYVVTGYHKLNLMVGDSGLKDKDGKELHLGQIYNISVTDFLALPENYRRSLYGYHAAFELSYQDPEFDPYGFGVIMSYEAYFDKLVEKYGARDIHVPQSYLYNSADVKLKFLAGYADGCGEYDGETLRFRIKNKATLWDILYLAKSLLFTAYITEDDVLEISGKLVRIPTEIVKMRNSKNSVFWYEICVEPFGKGTAYGLAWVSNTNEYEHIKNGDDQMIYLDDFTIVHV